MAKKKDKLMEVSDRISRLKQKQAEIQAELAEAKDEADVLKPLLTCLRCGWQWRARSIERLPNYCGRCHSAGWNRPPRARNSRRPNDPPNPRWPAAASSDPAPIPDPDPAPASTIVSSAILPDPPLWDPRSERLTIGLPPLPSLPSFDYPPFPALPTSLPTVNEEEERQPEHLAMPRRDPDPPAPDAEPDPEPEPDDPPAPTPELESEL